ncbi:substrate-binding periplasmic protein [Litoribrevibacter albus]|uniref:substrate-binding periplasmic protein n=1 Tax=Litoribrevibacter albus TaxID=1473156 RepID=UPI0024E05436|nr:transporter substrate-binding domain-containing protein [Litoribrevibacter albus]
MKQRKHMMVFSLAWLCFSAWAMGSDQSIKFGYGDHTTPPFVFRNDQGEVTQGITLELGRALADQVAMPVKFVGIPRPRLVQLLSEGDIDLYCFVKPEWIPDSGRFLWSPPLLTETAIFVLQNGAPDFKNYLELQGKHIGTIRGFRYSSILTKMFNAGDAIREDSTTLIQSLERLKHQRIDTMLGSDILIRFILKEHPEQYPFKLSRFSDSTDYTGCAISSGHYQKATLLIDAFKVIKESGRLEQILNAYR